MDLYHVWCNPKCDVSDVAFCEGLGPGDLGEFHVAIEVEDLAQRVNQVVTDLRFALYREIGRAHV